MVKALCVLLFITSAFCAEITLVYPRVMQGQDSFRYEAGIDSSFIFGQVGGATQKSALWCNGQQLRTEGDGAFLSFLRLPTSGETHSWILSLIDRGDTLARTEFAFGRLAASVTTPWMPLDPPVILTVTDAKAHTRTDIGGSYWHFPVQGAKLKAVAETPTFYRVEFAAQLIGVIDKSFVAVDSVTELPSIKIGNATVSHGNERTHVTFASSGITTWREQISEAGRRMELTLYDCVCAVDRIRYHGESISYVDDVNWNQQADGLHLLIRTGIPLDYGYLINSTDSTLTVSFRDLPRAGLRGKLIVLDPGHGGSADGAIGPRGSKEKDVVLNWAKVLARELETQGATVALTRERDQELSLADRVQFARKIGADVMLSLHANALPDGENPADRRGAGTYYYHSAGRELAEYVHSELLAATELANDGIFDANLAVVRPTDFPAVLIEAAYLMQPEEELHLRDEGFLVKLSQGVSRGLQRYFREASAR